MDYDYLKTNYEALTADIRKICDGLGRIYSDVKLIAVSKTFPPEQILEVQKFGQTDFGENKVQELISKSDVLQDAGINWHLIGHLQTNKVKYITDFVTLIHSVDSEKLAMEIDKHAKKDNKVIDILVQVNTSREGQKSGVDINETKNLYNEISAFENISIKGLMTIGMFTDDEDIIRENFRILKDLYDDIKVNHTGFKWLSMGMTLDYKIALEEGSNMLRIGSAIFGQRNYL